MMGPTWTVTEKDGVTYLTPAPDADLKNIRFGTSITQDPKSGMNRYALVGRRALQKLWRFDYANEAECDAESLDLFNAVLGFNAGDEWSPYPTIAVKITQYDEATGAVIGAK